MCLLYLADIPDGRFDEIRWPYLSSETIQEAVARYTCQHSLRAHLCALSTLGFCLSEYTGSPASELPEIAKMPGGKPFFTDPALPRFNYSHAGGLILLGIGSSDLGVDIEIRKKNNAVRISERFFSPEETDYIRVCPEERFFEIWVIREALGKYTGEGIQAFSRIAIDPEKETVSFEQRNFVDVWRGTYGNYHMAAVGKVCPDIRRLDRNFRQIRGEDIRLTRYSSH